MTILTLYACLLAEPSNCRRERITAQGMACMFGPMIAAEYVEEHDGWYVAKWSCGR